MATIRAKIDGLDELRLALGQAATALDQQLDDAVQATGLELRGDIIKRYNRGPTSGRWYQKYNPRRKHRASAPGEAPQSDQGDLARSVIFREVGKLSVEVAIAGPENGERAIIARTLEYGTKETDRIKPRPAWRPAAKKVEKSFNKRVAAVLARFTAK